MGTRLAKKPRRQSRDAVRWETLPRGDGGQAVTLNVELNPKVTAGLLAQAEARGLSLEAYVSEVLKERSREA
jgi:hypothetical protein